MRFRPWAWRVGAALVAALCLPQADAADAADAALTLMSLNILEDAGTPSSSNPNQWIYTAGPDRRDRAVRVIADQAADIVGIQELEPNQVADITGTNALAAYGWYGAGRNDGLSGGQHELILYRTNRFTRLGSGVFWLSLTPDTPGSKHPSAGAVRIAVWVRLLDRWSGRSLLAMNTHWDFSSAEARLYSAGLMRARIAALASNQWVVVTGDFNMYQSEQAYAALRGAEPGSLALQDAYRQVVPVEQAGELTRHNFSGGTAGRRVDYTFATGEFTATAASIVRTSYDGGRFPSDHYPVTASLRFAPVRPAIRSATLRDAAAVLAWSSVSGLSYRVRASPDLRAWADVWPTSGAFTARGDVSTAALPAVAGRAGYYRVVYRAE